MPKGWLRLASGATRAPPDAIVTRLRVRLLAAPISCRLKTSAKWDEVRRPPFMRGSPISDGGGRAPRGLMRGSRLEHLTFDQRVDALRCVDRCWPSARHARLSDTPSSAVIWPHA